MYFFHVISVHHKISLPLNMYTKIFFQYDMDFLENHVF
jgi:hypothetical protein